MPIKWRTPPDQLYKNLEDASNRFFVALHAIASRWGQQVQDDGRQRAPWTDRTGNARSGLFFAVDGLGLPTITGEVSPGAGELRGGVTVESGSDNLLIITFGHTVFYGRFLELSNAGRYAVVLSTLESNLPRLEQQLRQAFR